MSIRTNRRWHPHSPRPGSGRHSASRTAPTVDLSLSASKTAPGVTIAAQHLGAASVGRVTLSGSYLTISGFRIIGDQVEILPGTHGMTVSHNYLSGGYFGVDAGPTTSTNVTDVSIVGNKFVGPFGEDAIRVNRYHDSADADRAPGGEQRIHQCQGKRQPLRLPAIGLGRRQPLL